MYNKLNMLIIVYYIYIWEYNTGRKHKVACVSRENKV